jgi:ribonuclease HI
MVIVAVTNQAGKEAFLTEDKVAAFHKSWGHQNLTMFKTYEDKENNYNIKSPHALTKIIQQALSLQALPTQARATLKGESQEEIPPPTFGCHHPLSAPSKGAVYTDGSCIQVKDGEQRIGAAIYIGKNSTTIKVDPNGKGPTNTINRAELSAIHIALTHEGVAEEGEDIHLYTDSMCSIHMIRRILDSPWTLRESKHFQLLNNILDALRARAEAGGKTHIYKVKSHCGVVGNEAADKGAVAAAQNPNTTQVKDESENDPYSRRTWAALNPDPSQGDSDPKPLRYVPSLRDGIKRAIGPKASGGVTANTGIYGCAWEKAAPTLHQPSSFNFWKDNQITQRLKNLTFKARWGHLWNRKLAHRYGMAPNPNCPLCGQPDSTGHLLGGCHHPEAQAMSIARHDQSVKLIQKAISNSTLGGYYTIMDAGKASDLPEEVHGKRLPEWLFPSTEGLSQEDRDQLNKKRSKLRPDIMVIEGFTTQEATGETQEVRARLLQKAQSYKIHIFEEVYCGDTRHEEKDEEKKKQHAELATLLKSVELGSLDVKQHSPITLGRTGTIPSTLMTTLKEVFNLGGVAAPPRSPLLHYALFKFGTMFGIRFGTTVGTSSFVHIVVSPSIPEAEILKFGNLFLSCHDFIKSARCFSRLRSLLTCFVCPGSDAY